MKPIAGMAAMAVALWPSAGLAEVVSAGPHGFHVRHVVPLTVPTDVAYSAFSNVGAWWDKEHTYSGDSANLSLSLAPGGCFCERLEAGGGIEHLRVSYLKPGERIVFTGGLGPLLYQATAGVMDVKFERSAGGSQLTLDYRAAGFATGGAEKLAPLVDQVLGTQMKRYRAFAVARPRT